LLALRWSSAVLVASGLLAARPASAEDGATTELVVEGQRRAAHETAKDPTAATTVVTEERLGAPGLGTAAALRGTPGALVTEIGAFGSRATLSLRGSTAAQTPVYLGGVRVNDEVGGSADLGAIPLWFIERAEVYRGNAPIEADRLGIGGALFLEPRRPEGTFVELGGLVGSHQTREAWTAVGAGDRQNGVVAGLGIGAADNDYVFENDRGTQFVPADDGQSRAANAHGQLLDVWLHARRRLAETQFSWLAHYGRIQRGAPDSLEDPSRIAREDIDRTLTAVTARTPLGGTEQWLEVRNAAVLSSHRVEDPSAELGLGATELGVRGVRVEHALGLRLRPHPNWVVRPELSAALDRLERDEAAGSLDETPELVAHRAELRPALTARYSVPGTRLALHGVLALECTSAATGELSLCAQTKPTGRIGPSLRAGTLFVYANLGRYARWPTLGELHGASTLVRGNPRLLPELGETADIGVRHENPELFGLRVDAAAFVRRARDLILYAQTDQDYFAPQNLKQARVLGLELSAGFTALRGLDLDVELTALDARDVSPDRRLGNDVLPFRPRLVAAPRARFQQDISTPFSGGFSLQARYVYEANRYADLAGLEVIPEQHELELELGVSTRKPDVQVRLRMVNALDRARFDSVGFPLPGRSVYASIETRL